ncbi:SOS response-associated peptidase [Streptomyces sp. N2-109]|uniref:Abasic site processing protein n=1 Tax=Streptomyces gossypii TaxID=2883101 RepID=A0ABT2JUM8_9ACTN|nr:SOS response-associated peptidase [Streptomyces gossypii]MCT2591602.1 SOS response-associated peptidase [Streptomyces gossypii]
MCGRYVSTRSQEELANLFEVMRWDPGESLGASWNVAPTDQVWAVLERADRESGEVVRRLRPLRWGLVPSWAKDPKTGAKMINARMETVDSKPAYRTAFARRRCLLPADGFYEWETVRSGGRQRKQPYFVSAQDGGVMALAGLYEFWRDPQVADRGDPEAWWATCTVITTEATDAAGRIHPRMPLALAPENYAAWLDPAQEEPQGLRRLLAPPSDGELDARAVSPAVNNVRNDGPHLLNDPPADTPT